MKLELGKNLLIRKVENLTEEEAVSSMARSSWVGLRRAERLFELTQSTVIWLTPKRKARGFACLPGTKKRTYHGNDKLPLKELEK
jgi:hypothetical protein